MSTDPTRWYVRAETHLIRFGESRRDAIVWAVYRYTKRRQDRTPVLSGALTRVPTLAQALRYARNQARMTYGGLR